jgi:hypothetical protein
MGSSSRRDKRIQPMVSTLGTVSPLRRALKGLQIPDHTGNASRQSHRDLSPLFSFRVTSSGTGQLSAPLLRAAA